MSVPFDAAAVRGSAPDQTVRQGKQCWSWPQVTCQPMRTAGQQTNRHKPTPSKSTHDDRPVNDRLKADDAVVAVGILRGGPVASCRRCLDLGHWCHVKQFCLLAERGRSCRARHEGSRRGDGSPWLVGHRICARDASREEGGELARGAHVGLQELERES